MSLASPKARTQAAKRKAKAKARVVCAITGVEIGASVEREDNGRRQRPRASESEATARETSERAMCQRMGWPFNEAHRARCRGQHMGTLYGRLMEASRLTRDAYEGIEAYERLRDAIRREKLSARIPSWDHVTHDGEPRDLEALERSSQDANAVLRRLGQQYQQLVIAVIGREPADRYPTDWPVSYDGHLRIAGHELARHFGLRA